MLYRSAGLKSDRLLAAALAPLHALQSAPLPFDMPPVQVSLIWHRQQQHDPAHAWLRQQLVDLPD